MAATLHPFSGLQQAEDSMEISSEYGNMDADIDIDLDAPDTNMQSFQDDQQMQEDRPDDDLMIDDSNIDDNDRVMQDDAPVQQQEQDEELLDFSDDEEDIQMNPEEPSQPVPEPQQQPEPPVEPLNFPEEPVEQVQSEVASELLTEGVQPIENDTAKQEDDQSHINVEVQPPVTSEGTTSTSDPPVAQEQPNNEQPELQPENQEEVPAVATADPPAEHVENPAQEVVVESTETPHLTHEETAHHPTEEVNDGQHSQEQGNDETDVSGREDAKEPLNLTLTHQEKDLSNYTLPEDVSRERQPNSPTVTGLHPTIVEYDGNEVYLFPSRDPAVPEQYLLDNENLVTTSLGDLLQACRTALGDGITEDEELVLGVEELDLYVSEDSTPAFSTSFSELLDIYLQLHKLDGNDSPLPFRVSLSTKTRFTNRMSLITQAISEGKGFSQLDFLKYYQYDEPTELPDDDFDDDFEESIDSHKPQQHIEGNEKNEGAQVASELEGVDQQLSAPKIEDEQREQNNASQPAEAPEGEYVDQTSAQHADYTEELDQSEYRQDETQYFDAPQGEISEFADEHQNDEAAHAATEAESSHDTTNATSNDAHPGGEYEGEATEDHHARDPAAEADDYEPSVEEVENHDDNAEDNFFGQDEFFDENSYEYEEGEDAQEGETQDDEQLNIAATLDHPGQTDTAHVAEDSQVEPSGLIEVSNESAEPHVSTGVHDASNAETSVPEPNESTDDLLPAFEDEEVPNMQSKESVTVHLTEEADDDFDEINFDDEDGYEDPDTVAEAAKEPSKTSPAGKRSFSELEEVDDEQDIKKARAS